MPNFIYILYFEFNYIFVSLFYLENVRMRARSVS